MRKLLAIAVLVLAPTPALAADTAPLGRYTLTPSANGFVRLDTQTGQVSECTGAASPLVCRSSPDERAAMQAEIDRLQKEVDSLKAASPSQLTSDPGPQLNLPSDKEVDKAFSFMERMIKRFKGLMQEMRKDPTESTPL